MACPHVLFLHVILGVFLCGCAGPNEVIVLTRLLDPGSGSVTVEHGRQVAVFQAPLQTGVVRDDGLRLQVSSVQAVAKRFGDVLGALPAPEAVYTVFFARGEATLSEDADLVLTQVLHDVAARGPAVEVEITGHTDTVGTHEENDVLGLERARAVQMLLQERGLHPGLLRIVGRGERELLEATPDNTPNARNRRVVIILR